jgi:hypothetical protein
VHRSTKPGWPAVVIITSVFTLVFPLLGTTPSLSQTASTSPGAPCPGRRHSRARAPTTLLLHLGGIDLDTCRDPKTGEIAPWAQEIIDRFQTYTEISPSQTGVKLFFTYRIVDQGEINRLFDGKHGRSFKNGSGEIAQQSRFIAQIDSSQLQRKKSAPMASSGKSVSLIWNG